MKNWATLEPDLYRLMNKHYTPGRGGRTIKFIVRHHNAGVLTTEQCWQLWQTRQASAHYQVEVTGRIGQLVNDWDTAWHAANLLRNQESIGIEHSNSGGAAAGWPIAEKTIEEGAHLAAALCVAYRLGRPVFGGNIRDHKETGQTACPYHLAAGGKYHDQWMRRAQYWFDTMTRTSITPPPTPSPSPRPSGDTMTPAQEKKLDTVLARLDAQDKAIEDIRLQQGYNGGDYKGFAQGGHRSLYDLAAATAATLDVPDTRDTASPKN